VVGDDGLEPPTYAL